MRQKKEHLTGTDLEPYVLQIYSEIGERNIPLSIIYAIVKGRANFTKIDFEEILDKNNSLYLEERYKNSVRQANRQLKKKGLIKSPKRGCWKLEDNFNDGQQKEYDKLICKYHSLTRSQIYFPDEVDEDESIIEGATKRVIVNAYERNKDARKKCIAKHGVSCSVCKIDFEKIYGKIGKDFIHVHHLKPLAEIKQEYCLNPMKDLRPVCPNCHAMLHRRTPPFSIQELKEIIDLYKTASL